MHDLEGGWCHVSYPHTDTQTDTHTLSVCARQRNFLLRLENQIETRFPRGGSEGAWHPYPSVIRLGQFGGKRRHPELTNRRLASSVSGLADRWAARKEGPGWREDKPASIGRDTEREEGVMEGWKGGGTPHTAGSPHQRRPALCVCVCERVPQRCAKECVSILCHSPS